MRKCLNCGADLPPKIEGKRERKFCDNKGACKQKYWVKQNPKKKDNRRMIELPKDFINCEKVGIIRADGTIEEIKHTSQLPSYLQTAFSAVKDLTKTTGEVKPPEQPTTNYTVNTKVKEGDPKEGTMSFFNKFGCMYYSEIKK